MKKKQELNRNYIQPKTQNDNLHFGKDLRFKLDQQKAQIPGPGNYQDDVNWNKRTYNLKFLNF